jgi:NADPH2:quinone reductase
MQKIYMYGALDLGPHIMSEQFGMARGGGGWLITWFYERIDSATADRLRQQAADEMMATFVSDFSAELGLAEMFSLDTISAYTRRATGAKYLVTP